MKKQTILKITSTMTVALMLGCSKIPVSLPASSLPFPAAPTVTAQAASQAKLAKAQKAPARKDLTPTKIHLQPVSEATVKKEMELRKSQEDAPEMDAQELETIKALLSQAEEQIASEDQQHEQSKTKDFSVKSAQGGKDVEIGLLLYNAKYIRKAKFWGIKTADDFLKAGRSPYRRWTLKLKLEGLFAPGWFEQQLLFWVEQADLLRVPGVSRDDAYLLVANGVTSVPDLARRNNIIEIGALKLSMAIMAFQYGFDAPSMDEIQKWVDDAKNLEPLVY